MENAFFSKPQLENPEDFFHQIGGLHDARIESIQWVPHERKVSMKINDLNSNSLGLPEYEGLLPVTLVFSNVGKMIIGIDPIDEHLHIYEVDPKITTTHINVMTKFWPGGRMEFTCSSIEVQENKNI